MRCGTLGTSGHVTAKSSICDWGVLYKSGVQCVESSVSYPGRSAWCFVTKGMAEMMWHRRETRRKTEKTNLSLKPEMGLRLGRPSLTAMQKSAEGIVGFAAGKASEALQSRKAEETDRPSRKPGD